MDQKRLTGTPASHDVLRARSRRLVYLLDLTLWPLVLVGAPAAVHFSKTLGKLVPDPIGPIPLSVIWWGGLGGLVISMRGVLKNRDEKWDPAYAYWHYSRVPLSAVAGAVGYMIAILLLPTEPAFDTPRGQVFAYLVAFVVGFREAFFFDLLQRFQRTMFPSRPTAATLPSAKAPSEGAHG